MTFVEMPKRQNEHVQFYVDSANQQSVLNQTNISRVECLCTKNIQSELALFPFPSPFAPSAVNSSSLFISLSVVDCRWECACGIKLMREITCKNHFGLSRCAQNFSYDSVRYLLILRKQNCKWKKIAKVKNVHIATMTSVSNLKCIYF